MMFTLHSMTSCLGIILFLISLVAVVYIGRFKVPNVTKKMQLDRSLCRGLWKFTPSYIADKMHQKNLWNWRKLIVCGVMISSFFLLTTARVLSHTSSAIISIIMFIIWTCALHLFWYFMLADKDSEGDEMKNGLASEKVSPAWEDKVRTRSKDLRLPTTIITGFLGSGKTTLVNHLLSNTLGLKILVVENEVGQEGIDHELLLQHTKKEQIILLNNGCVCCSVRGDLIQTFKQLFKSDAFSSLDWVVIETTGIADPAPVIQTLFMDPDCNKHMRLDACITMVDCKNIGKRFESFEKEQSCDTGADFDCTVPEAIQQIAFADCIILNKTDLVSSCQIQDVSKKVTQINPSATLIKTQKSQVSPDKILNIHAFDPSKHNDLLLSFDKGRLCDENIGSSKEEHSNIISIRHSRKKSQFPVNTVSLVANFEIDLEKFNIWIAKLLQEKGNDLYRYKGILAMRGYDEKFVVQGVHMLFDGERSGKWEGGVERRSKLVFIGANLSRNLLQEGFQKCQSSDSSTLDSGKVSRTEKQE